MNEYPKKFNANCNNADNCININCEHYTPKLTTVEKIEPPHYCKHNQKLVFQEPWTTRDWEILQSMYPHPCNLNGVVVDHNTVSVQEGI